MSTLPGHEKIVDADGILRVISTAAQTVSGAANAKGTATDMTLFLVCGADGATAVSGSLPVTVQGSNSTVASTFTGSITPDKGSLPTFTAAGTGAAHFQNLQFAYYRVQVAATAAATGDIVPVLIYQPVADSFDATVQ